MLTSFREAICRIRMDSVNLSKMTSPLVSRSALSRQVLGARADHPGVHGCSDQGDRQDRLGAWHRSEGASGGGPGLERAICEPLDSIEAKCQIVQVLRDDVVVSENGSLLCVEYRRDAHVLLLPILILRHRLQKTSNVLLEVVDIG
jgi:hypothetical protein